MSDSLYLDAELLVLTARRPLEPRDSVLSSGPPLAPLPGIGCGCCASIIDNGRRRSARAVARWATGNGNVVYLCKTCLDHWFDNADDDDSLEPAAWSWLPGRRPEQLAPA